MTSGDDSARTSIPAPRPRRALSAFDRIVRVPIGSIWLAVLVIVALPVFICMTILYWIVQGAQAVFGKGRTQRAGARGEREERVA